MRKRRTCGSCSTAQSPSAHYDAQSIPAIALHPNAVSFLCPDTISESATCTLVANLANEDVIADPQDGAPPFTVPSERVARVTLQRKTLLTVTGASSKTVYVDKLAIDGPRQLVFVQPSAKPQYVSANDFPWLALMIALGLITIIVGIIIGATNGKVSRYCTLSVSDIMNISSANESVIPATKSESGSASTSASPSSSYNATEAREAHCKKGGLTISWAWIFIPALFFAGSVVAFFLLAAPTRIRATNKECAARGNEWNPGFDANRTSSMSKLLCRLFGVCNCMNYTAQSICRQNAFLKSQGTTSRVLFIDSPHGFTEGDDQVQDLIRIARLQRSVPDSTSFDDALTRISYQDKQNVEDIKNDPVPTEAYDPMYTFDQNIANRPKNWDCDCCPTKSAPKGSTCLDCTVYPCVPCGLRNKKDRDVKLAQHGAYQGNSPSARAYRAMVRR